MEKLIRTHTKTSQETVNQSNEWESFITKFDFIITLFEKHSGTTFGNGIFRIHTQSSSIKWSNLLANEYFKDELDETDLICFGFNWQGIMYCINSKNDTIIYFDPATCDFFKAEDISINDFFDNVLLDPDYDLLSVDYYNEAMRFLKIKNLNFNDSIGHKIYLHLGGEDEVSNLEVIDTEVLWDTQIQVAESINELPD